MTGTINSTLLHAEMTRLSRRRHPALLVVIAVALGVALFADVREL